MKIYVYRRPTDKIPLNAIPFYHYDTMDLYEVIIDWLSYTQNNLAKDWHLFDKKEIDELMKKLDECAEYNDYVPITIPDVWSQWLCWYYENNQLDLCLCDDNLIALTKEKDSKSGGLIVTIHYELNVSFKWRLNILNDFYHKQWYDHIEYNFPIAHHIKPDIWKDEYDFILRTGSTDTFMWYRTYVKNFNKNKKRGKRD